MWDRLWLHVILWEFMILSVDIHLACCCFQPFPGTAGERDSNLNFFPSRVLCWMRRYVVWTTRSLCKITMSHCCICLQRTCSTNGDCMMKTPSTRCRSHCQPCSISWTNTVTENNRFFLFLVCDITQKCLPKKGENSPVLHDTVWNTSFDLVVS